MEKSAIQERYSKEVETEHCGCSNLWPLANVKPGMAILDLGCGNGMQTNLFAEQSENGAVIGIDITEEMLESARKFYTRPNLSFLLADIDNIPLSDNSFDLVTSNCVINHAPDKAKVYSEVYRLLKSGGHFLISDVCAIDNIAAEDAADPKKIAECWAGALPRDEYLEKICSAGFESVAVLASRQYTKADHLLESIIVKGVKK